MRPVRAEPQGPDVSDPMGARYEVQPRPVAAQLVHATEAGAAPAPEAGPDKPDAAEAAEEPGPPVSAPPPCASARHSLPQPPSASKSDTPRCRLCCQAATLGELYQFTSTFEKMLLVVAVFAAVGTGASMPMMLIAFGNAFDQLGERRPLRRAAGILAW